MQDVVHLPRQEDVLRDVLPDEPQGVVPGQVRDVVDRPRQQIVDARDAVSLAEKGVAQMAAQEPRAAGDDRVWLTHRPLRFDLEFPAASGL